MHKLFWYGGLGTLVAAGVVYMAAHSEQKSDFTLGGPPRTHSCERLESLVAYGACVESEEPAEVRTLAMPPQIIDVCETPHLYRTIINDEELELTPAGAVDETTFEAVEEICLPREVHDTEECTMPRCGQPGGVEDAEEIHHPMPGCGDEGEDDNPIGKVWKSLFHKDIPELYEPMEGIEESEESEMPACQEDPHHSEHYPVCPYTGRSYRSCPSAAPSCPSSPANLPRCQEGTEECTPEKNDADPEAPAQPGIDTMEYRPSDAHEGEFEPKPMM